MKSREFDSLDPYGHDMRGAMCQRQGCGKTMQFVHTLAGVGAFCSQKCRDLSNQDRQKREQKRSEVA